MNVNEPLFSRKPYGWILWAHGVSGIHGPPRPVSSASVSCSVKRANSFCIASLLPLFIAFSKSIRVVLVGPMMKLYLFKSPWTIPREWRRFTIDWHASRSPIFPWTPSIFRSRISLLDHVRPNVRGRQVLCLGHQWLDISRFQSRPMGLRTRTGLS